MKRLFFILLLASLLTACGGQSAPATAAPAPAPVEPLPAQRSTVTASAEVVPLLVSELAFPISGPLKLVDVRPGDLVQAGQTLAALDVSELDFAILQAEAVLVSAQTDWSYYSQERTKEFKPPERLQAAEAQLAAAQAALETARLTQAQSTLTAPFDGVVISVDARPGEIASAGRLIIVLARLDQFEIETTDLSERNIAALKPGQKAVVYIEALDQEFSGQVARIAPRAGKKDGDVVFTVTVTLDEQPQGLRWGMSAEVRIQTGE
jgi:HlyD family secretion protein